MPNNLSPELLAQLYAQDSSDPYLLLVTLSHPDMDTLRLVNNTVSITSRGQIFTAFPMRITLPTDDGESTREAQIVFDNVGLDLVPLIRSVTSPIQVKFETILASDPDSVQISYQDLELRSVSYDKSRISAKIYMDGFLNQTLTSEKYTPSLYPGLF